MAQVPAAPITIRPATDADLLAEHGIFSRAEGGLLRAHGYPWTDPPFDRFEPSQRHLLRHDPDRCFVAEADGVIVGFTAAFVRDDRWYLAALFIEPDVQGQGIGRALFRAAFADAPPLRMTITDSIQPVSNALYASFGLIPTVPILTFEGVPKVDAPGNLRERELDRGDLRTIDLATYGFDRAVEHALWEAGATRTMWERDGEVVAYSYARSDGHIGPLAAVDASAAANALRAELARVGECWVEIPGSSRSLVEVALEARLRISPPPGLLLLAPGMAAPRNLAISGYFLF